MRPWSRRRPPEQGADMSIGCLAFLFLISIGALVIAYLLRR